MFIAALLTIAKIKKQLKCPSMDEWIKKTHRHIHTHRGMLLSHKKKEILPFVTTWIVPEGIMLSEISQRKTNIDDLTYMWNL